MAFWPSSSPFKLLMLPVNYGILIADKTIPKVANLGNQKPLKVAEDAWLVWEGKDGVTYLVRGRQAGKEQRTLITLPRSDVKEIKIIAYDPILRVLFAERASPHNAAAGERTGGTPVKKILCTFVHRLVALLPVGCLLLTTPYWSSTAGGTWLLSRASCLPATGNTWSPLGMTKWSEFGMSQTGKTVRTIRGQIGDG